MTGPATTGDPPTVSIRLFGGLAALVPGAVTGVPVEVPLRHGETLGQVLARLGVPEAEVGLAAVGGCQVGLDHRPAAGDEVVVSAPADGG